MLYLPLYCFVPKETGPELSSLSTTKRCFQTQRVLVLPHAFCGWLYLRYFSADIAIPLVVHKWLHCSVQWLTSALPTVCVYRRVSGLPINLHIASLNCMMSGYLEVQSGPMPSSFLPQFVYARPPRLIVVAFYHPSLCSQRYPPHLETVAVSSLKESIILILQ